MVDTFGMAGALVLIFLVLVAVYILMRMFGFPESGEDGEENESSEPEVRRVERPAEIGDEEFIDAYTGPMLEDARDSLEIAVDSIRAGLRLYDTSAWVSAGDEFHAAIRKLDEAADRFDEIPGLVEDQGLKPVLEAKARMDDCRRLKALTARMEEASDAMVEGKADEAQKSAMVKSELKQFVSAFQ